ncbi:MAG: T9SS type A sorting domain-containing protein, partial [Bacteroidetes bacterium]|nr:T9SS type A sorting domain-containing protein [Bacteroidota bacterium]
SYGGLSCGIYRSFNGGLTWTELTNGLPSPGTNIGRIGMDICMSDPSTLYAIYADKTGYFEGVYKTINGGDSWVQTNDGSLADCYSSYGWWFGRIKVDPTDPDIAYVIGFDLYKTSNGGNSWNNVSSWSVHVDQHELYIHPLNHNFLALGNDGGFYISQNGGNNWSWMNNLPVIQFYTSEMDNQHPERLYGGTQDNGTNRTLTGNTDDWQEIYGGDGFYVLVDPENNNYVYAEYQYGNFAKSTNGGNSFNIAMTGISTSDRKNWCTPVVFDPTNPEIMYYGANRLYRTTNRASSWSVISDDLTNGPGNNLTYGTITTISVSPVNPEIIYVGTDDGNVWVSAMTGSGWDYLSLNLPDRWVTRVAADPWDENTAFVTFSGYRWDEYLPHIFRTTDKGQNWEDISGNLPEMPVNDVIIDPEKDSSLYVATDAGVFVTHNMGQIWEMMGSNLPNVPVNDLTLHNQSRKLVAATYGRSMYAYNLYQDTVSTSIQKHVINPVNAQIKIYPNPFSQEVHVEIECQSSVAASIEIYNPKGSRVDVPHRGKFIKGTNRFSWKPDQKEGNGDGIYLLKIVAGELTVTRKIILIQD